MNDETLLEFPCDFPLKIMGRDSDTFQAIVTEIVSRHASAAPATTRPSSGGSYIAMSFVIRAESREQLDELYRELSANKDVLYVL